jgi:hypothetical protein
VKREAFAEELVERGAVHEAHGEEVEVVDVAGGVDGDDVGMFESSDELGLAEEALFEFVEGKEAFFQDFDGDGTIEGELDGAVDASGGAAADEVVEAEVPQRTAD